MKKYLSKNLNETKKIAKKLLHNFSVSAYKNQATIISLNGDLGSGKTTLSQKIAEVLEIKEKITSPTFVISKTYSIKKDSPYSWKKLIHIDAYRLSSKNDLKNIGLLNELQKSENLILIEWFENIEKFLDKSKVKKINLKYISKNEREISF